jgi:hypothetical protein
MCKHGKEIVLRLPDNIDTGKENRTVSVDECIASAIKRLWANRIDTRGCCCGHGKGNPSIVIAEGYCDDEVAKIVELLSEVDVRKWDVFQWRLVMVSQ